MIRLSLRFRLLLVSAGLVAGATLLIGGVAYHEYGEGAMRSLDQTLRAKATGVLAAVDDEEDLSVLKRDADAIVGVRKGRRSPMYRVWVNGAPGDVIASDPPGSDRGQWLRDMDPPPAPDANSWRYAEIGEHRDEYRAVWARRKVKSGQVCNVIVAESVHYALHEIGEFRNILLTVAGCAGVAMLVFAVLAVRRALRPIQVVAERLDRVTYRDMDADALRDSPGPPELRPFVESTARMLERLRRAFETQEQFIADASHELRTPLAVAKSSLQAAVVKGKSLEGLQQAITDALEDIDRVQHVTDQLLKLARLGRAPTAQEPSADIELKPFLTGLAERYDGLAARTGGNVVVTDVPEATIPGRRTELEGLFGNLIENAIVHGPPSGTVTIRAAVEGDDAIIVCVHDKGGAIAPEELPRLFDRFYRTDRSRSRRTGGSGLGLAIAREIALRHGGEIWMESSPGKGTEVFVRLPRRSDGPATTTS